MLVPLVLVVALGTQPAQAPTNPQVRRAVIPEYPDVGRQAIVLGRVVLELTIRADGTVSSVEVLRTPPLLDTAAREAAQRWLFEPGGLQRTARITLIFDLLAPNVPPPDLYGAFVAPDTVEVKGRCMRRCDKLEEIRKTAF
jgi:TonB family protein